MQCINVLLVIQTIHDDLPASSMCAHLGMGRLLTSAGSGAAVDLVTNILLLPCLHFCLCLQQGCREGDLTIPQPQGSALFQRAAFGELVSMFNV
jgi:hypothetical protein